MSQNAAKISTIGTTRPMSHTAVSPPGTARRAPDAASWRMPVMMPMATDATASAPVIPMSSSPTSLSCTNPRGGAVSKTRAIPVDIGENRPRAPHSRKRTLKIVMPPRDSMTASITPPTVSASSGDPACTCPTTNARASPSPRTNEPITTARTRSWNSDSSPKYAMLPAYWRASCAKNPVIARRATRAVR
jgi:hypothetical protein